MDASANAKQHWTPEVAARLRGVMIAFLVVLLLSMVTTIAYVAGRTVSAPVAPSYVQTAPVKAAPPQPVTVPQQPAVIPEETVRHAAIVSPTAHTAARDASADAAVSREREADSATPVRAPQPGRYLQVAAVELAPAEKIVETINRNGLAAVVAPGPSERIFRVVVGPLDSVEMAAQAQAALVEKGYQTFPRRY